MKNETIKHIVKDEIKKLLAQCTEAQQMVFKRMYCHQDLGLSIEEAVDQMADDKLDRAFSQVENTVAKNRNAYS